MQNGNSGLRQLKAQSRPGKSFRCRAREKSLHTFGKLFPDGGPKESTISRLKQVPLLRLPANGPLLVDPLKNEPSFPDCLVHPNTVLRNSPCPNRSSRSVSAHTRLSTRPDVSVCGGLQAVRVMLGVTPQWHLSDILPYRYSGGGTSSP